MSGAQSKQMERKHGGLNNRNRFSKKNKNEYPNVALPLNLTYH